MRAVPTYQEHKPVFSFGGYFFIFNNSTKETLQLSYTATKKGRTLPTPTIRLIGPGMVVNVGMKSYHAVVLVITRTKTGSVVRRLEKVRPRSVITITPPKLTDQKTNVDVRDSPKFTEVLTGPPKAYWTIEDVHNFLSHHDQLWIFSEIFQTEQINGQALVYIAEPRLIELGVHQFKYLRMFWELLGKDPAELSTRPQRRIRPQKKEKQVEECPTIANEAPPQPAYPSPVPEEDKQSGCVAEEEDSSEGSEEKEGNEEDNVVEVNREPETFLPRQLSSPKVGVGAHSQVAIFLDRRSSARFMSNGDILKIFKQYKSPTSECIELKGFIRLLAGIGIWLTEDEAKFVLEKKGTEPDRLTFDEFVGWWRTELRIIKLTRCDSQRAMDTISLFYKYSTTTGTLTEDEFRKVHEELKAKELLKSEAPAEGDWEYLTYGQGFVKFNDYIRWMGVAQ